MLANRTVVEGYAHAKKCSNEGRALMQLDYQQFLTKLDQIVVLKWVFVFDYSQVFFCH